MNRMTIRLSAAFLLLAAVSTAHGGEAFVKMWDGKEVRALQSVNPEWRPYGAKEYRQGKDDYRSSHGLTRAFSYPGKGPLPEPFVLRVPLEKNLPAGTYMVYVRNYHLRGKMEISLGHESKFVNVPRYEWCSGAIFEVDPAQKAADCIQLKLYPTMVEDSGSAQTQTYTVQGVFITTDLKKVPKKDGEVLELAPLEPPAPRAGNYLEGASFECGLGHGWGKPSGVTLIIDASNLDDSTAGEGRTSLRVPLSTTTLVNAKPRLAFLESKMLPLPPDRDFVLSFYAKAETPMKIGAGLRCMNRDLKNYAAAGMAGTVDVTTEWQRFEITGKSVDAPGYLSSVYFSQPDLAQASALWIDGIQLEEGRKANAFAPASPVEVGCVSTVAGNIYFDNEPAALELRFDNPGLAKSTVLAFRVEDYWGRIVAEGARDISLPGRNHAEKFVLSTAARGIFRATFTADKGAPAQIVYSVLPPSASLDKPVPNGTVGMDCHFDSIKALKIYKRANFHWLHTKFQARWSLVEPEKGKFRFKDDEIKNAHAMGFSLVLQLLNEHPAPQKFVKECMPGEGVDAAQWCRDNPDKKAAYLKHFGDYAAALVQRYKPWVRHYEIENEPNYPPLFRLIYPEMLKSAYESMKAVDPAITVIGFSLGGFDIGLVPNWVAGGALKYCDVASIHIYGGGSDPVYAQRFSDFINQHNKPGWNTETGLSGNTFYRLPTFEAVTQKDYWAEHDRANRYHTDIQTRNYLHTMAVKGMQRFIYYFGRYTNMGPSQPTRWGGSCKEIGEFDGALRSTGVALSIASHHLDGASFVELLKVHEKIHGALFERNGKALGFFFKHDQSDDTGTVLEFTGDALKALRFSDIMGNGMAKEKAPAISATPVYFDSELPAAKLRELLAAPRSAAAQ